MNLVITPTFQRDVTGVRYPIKIIWLNSSQDTNRNSVFTFSYTPVYYYPGDLPEEGKFMPTNLTFLNTSLCSD